MIEVLILCSAPCDIPDLGLFGIERGDERWVSLVAASRSRDLANEESRGRVRTFKKDRSSMAAPSRPLPPFVARSRSGAPTLAPPRAPEAKVERSFSLDDVREVVRQELGKRMEEIEGVLERALERIAARTPLAPAPRDREERLPDDPLFLPSMARTETKGRLATKLESSGETEDLDGARELLRKMKQEG